MNFKKYLLFLLVCTLYFTFTQAQQLKGTVKGHIYTTDNKPAGNVSVKLRGTSFGTITNTDGYFELRVPEGSYLLALTHIGVETKTYNIQIFANKILTLPNTTINAGANALKEVAISGGKINKFKFKRSDDVAKMPLDNLENPQVYSTISPALLQEQSIFTVDDAIKNAPGLQQMWEPTNRGGDGGSYFNSRGFVVSSQFRNGIASNITSSIDAINIDRIEVIKGPSATLFGSGLTSYGGLINRVTKKPYDTFGGDVSVTGGNLGYKRISTDINAPLNGKKNLMFRLNTAYTYQEGTQNNFYNKNFAITPSLLYKVNDKLSIGLDAEIYSGSGSAKAFFFFPYGQSVAPLGVTTADKLNIDFTKSYADRSLVTKYISGSYIGSVNYKISGNWTSQTVATINTSYSNGSNPYFYVIGQNRVSRNDQSTQNSKKNVTEIQQNFNGDFKIGSLRNRVLVGLDYLHINSNQLYLGAGIDTVLLNSPTASYNNYNSTRLAATYAAGKGFPPYPIVFSSDTYSAYISDVLNITDQFSALAALRVDNYHNNGNVDLATGAKSNMYKQTTFSPKFGLVFQPVKDQVSLFANYQNSFTNQAGADFTGKIFKPEHANQLEGGLKLDVINGKLSTTVSYYNIKVTDILRTDPAHAFFSVQDGTQISKGFEMEVIANPFAGFNMTGGFAYNDSKYTKIDADILGFRPTTASSPYSATFWASYKIQSNELKGLGAGFGGNYASENHIVNSLSQGTFSLPAYTAFRSSVFYDQRKYRLGVTVNNLTSEKYFIGYTTANPQNLRQVLVTGTFRF